jgi:prophage DNA circulation protein
MAFADTLQQASWRGVPFGIDMAGGQYGRRVVEHVYPYRDSIWAEDQGKLPRRFSLVGFLIADSAKYGGGDLQTQIAAMAAAAEATGPGILVHPIHGIVRVSLSTPLAITIRGDEGRVAELQFSFVQGSAQLFPAIADALGALVGDAAGLADLAGVSALTDALAPLENGVSSLNAITATAGEWSDKIQSLARDATSLYGTVSLLGGSDFGRYFNGRNSGFLTGLVSPYSAATSVPDLISLGAANRAAVATAAAAIDTALAGYGVTTRATDVAAAVQATVGALQASVADPADGVRMLSGLAAFTPISPGSRAAAGVATTNLFQRAVATAIARVSATYAPASADDASAARMAVLAPIEQVIDVAGESGEDAVLQTFRALRKAVVDNLGAQGASLPRLITVDSPSAMPSVVLA